MKGLDPISQMAARDLGLRDLPLPFEDLNPLFFLKPLSGGQLLLVIGEKGTGKTDWALTLAAIAINAGWVVISNIGLRYNVENYIFCQNFSSMLLAMCRAKLGIGTSDGKPKRVLLVLDEAGIQFASQQVSTGTFKQLDKFAKLFRKFGVDWVYITQYGKPKAVLARYDEYEALLKLVEDLEDLLAMKDSLSAPEEEAIGLEDYERQRAARVRG